MLLHVENTLFWYLFMIDTKVSNEKDVLSIDNFYQHFPAQKLNINLGLEMDNLRSLY